MFLDPVLEKFVEKRPVAVMARLVAQRALSIIGQDLPVGERSPSRLEVLEGVGHLVPTSDPRALRRAIDSVLS